MCRFVETYPDNSVASALPFAMNSEFSPTLAKEMVCPASLKWNTVVITQHVDLARTHTHTHTHTEILHGHVIESPPFAKSSAVRTHWS